MSAPNCRRQIARLAEIFAKILRRHCIILKKLPQRYPALGFHIFGDLSNARNFQEFHCQ
jgi:hypothetical protein